MRSRIASVLLGASLWLPATAANVSSVELRDTAQDPRDFSWIKKWAAVGDSFTAGIGSGMIWSQDDNSYDCSRYDLSYAAILNNYFGPSVENFNYLACSGANSNDIYGQINTLPDSSQDVVVLTAGGNDLCLSTLIYTCILSSQTTLAACNSAQQSAQNFIDSQLGNNLDQIIDAAVSKLDTNGVFVFSQYAQFFNDVADAPCHFDEDWVFPGTAGGGSLLLTTSLRHSLNTLVINTNNVINQAVIAAQKRHSSQKVEITTASWDSWLDAVPGRMCEAFEKPDPNDPANENAAFFKLDTTKRAAAGALDAVLFTDNETSVHMQHMDNVTAALEQRFGHSLDVRNPVAPNCGSSIFNGLLPDNVGKIFHPTPWGHLSIASYVGDAIAVARANVINAPNPDCTDKNDLTCFQDKGSKSYASPYSLYSNTEDFCNTLVSKIPSNTANWQFSKSYYDGTPDSSAWKVQLQNGGTSVTFAQCHDAVNEILNGCDGNDPKNPMNWKFGGSLETETVIFSITPTRTGRVMPPYTTPIVACDAWYKVFYDSWDIYGGGFSDWDYGQKTILGNFTSCTGSTPTHWRFQYYDQPDENGYEWHAWGGSVIWIKNRCMGGVIKAAGGPSGASCKGNG